MSSAGAVCVLTAAGGGSRLRAEKPKALVDLAGRSLLSWALSGLAKSGCVSAIVVTAPADNLEAFEKEISSAAVDLPVTVVAGGRSRQESVANGLEAVAELCGKTQIPLGPDTPTLVHDAARPLTPPALIASLVEAVAGGKAAVIPALPVTDTIKVVEPADGIARVVDTPPRALLRSVQTPQAFRWELINQVHEKGRHLGAEESASVTDDAGLVEMFGGQVWVVPGSPEALKITTEPDLIRAQSLVKGRVF